MGGGLPQLAPGPAPQAPPLLPQAPLIPSSPDAPKVPLELRTEPAGATIVMLGEVVGVTPMEVQAQTAAPMRVALLLQGYEPVLFPTTPEDFPQLAARAGGSPIVLTPTPRTFGLLEVAVPAVGSAHVLVDGIDAGEEPVLVAVRFVAGAVATRIDVTIPGLGTTRLDVKSVAVPWGFATYEHPSPGGAPPP